MDSYTVCDKCKKAIPVGGSFILVSVERQHQEQDSITAGISTKFIKFICEECALNDRVEIDVAEAISDMPTVEEEMADREEASELMVFPDQEDKPATTSCSRCKRDFVPGDVIIEISLSKYDFDRPNVDKVYGFATWCYCAECSKELDYKSVPVMDTVEGFDKE